MTAPRSTGLTYKGRADGRQSACICMRMCTGTCSGMEAQAMRRERHVQSLPCLAYTSSPLSIDDRRHWSSPLPPLSPLGLHVASVASDEGICNRNRKPGGCLGPRASHTAQLVHPTESWGPGLRSQHLGWLPLCGALPTPPAHIPLFRICDPCSGLGLHSTPLAAQEEQENNLGSDIGDPSLRL